MSKPPVTPLKVRFEAFVRNLKGTEQIDTLLTGRDSEGMKRADYLFEGRSIIAEQKSLDVDPEPKVQEFINRLMTERGLLAYGRVRTNDVFKLVNDAELQQKRLFLTLTNHLDKLVSRADKQTRDTKRIFDIPRAAGMLIILNEKAKPFILM